jgi:hypothetical protein
MQLPLLTMPPKFNLNAKVTLPSLQFQFPNKLIEILDGNGASGSLHNGHPPLRLLPHLNPSREAQCTEAQRSRWRAD